MGLEKKRKLMEEKIQALRSEFDEEILSLENEILNEKQRIKRDSAELSEISIYSP